jgi:anti-anti-sigma regulatory factor
VLRITRDDERSTGVTLKLEGRLIEPWASLLEQECAAAESSGREVRVDLSGVTIVEKAGVEALQRLHRSGVVLAGCSDLVASVLAADGITL